MTDPTRHSDLARSLRASLEAARHYRDVDRQLAFAMLDTAVERTLLALRHSPGTELYAAIRSDSPRVHEQEWIGGEGMRFPVVIDPRRGDHCVVGGPGALYRLSDVALFAAGEQIN